MKKKRSPAVLVPKTVSFNQWSKKGYQSRGTKAFVLNGTRLSRGLTKPEKFAALRDLAEKSDYYIKRVTPRNRKIRAFVEKYGVRVEKIIEDLKDGTCLFEREGYALDSPEGKKVFLRNPDAAMQKIAGVMAKLIVLEVTHWHPHRGNFALTEKGDVILLDLGKATLVESEKHRPPILSIVRKLHLEKQVFLQSFLQYYFQTVLQRAPTEAEWNRLWKAADDSIHHKIQEFASEIGLK